MASNGKGRAAATKGARARKANNSGVSLESPVEKPAEVSDFLLLSRLLFGSHFQLTLLFCSVLAEEKGKTTTPSGRSEEGKSVRENPSTL